MKTALRYCVAHLLAPALILSVAACSSTPTAVNSPSSVSMRGASDIDLAMDLLNRGDEAGALKRIRIQLKHNPGDPSANVLLESLKRDPVDLLGQQSFAYTVRGGDTMISLSERFLGNRLKFYQLARYNGVKIPMSLAQGTVLRIPGEVPRPVVVPIRQNTQEPTGTPPPARPKPGPVPAVKAPANPGAALKLRSLGLAALNQGQVAQAVTLLGRAAQLDPSNALIARDLARAKRIAQTVKARR